MADISYGKDLPSRPGGDDDTNVSISSGNEALRAIANNDYIYQHLLFLHRQDHLAEGCFCTTEVAGAYRNILKELNRLIEQECAARQLRARKNENGIAMNLLELATEADNPVEWLANQLADRAARLDGWLTPPQLPTGGQI